MNGHTLAVDTHTTWATKDKPHFYKLVNTRAHPRSERTMT